jgi:hypothetical protein
MGKERRFIRIQPRKRMEIMKRLRDIIDSRRDDGKLQRVSLGWYPATLKTITKDKEDSWNVEWIQLM